MIISNDDNSNDSNVRVTMIIVMMIMIVAFLSAEAGGFKDAMEEVEEAAGSRILCVYIHIHIHIHT